MDKKYGINLICAIIFSILYFIFITNYINEVTSSKYISGGLYFIIIGVWGLMINNILLKIGFLYKYPKLINIILIVIGLIIIVGNFFY
jgi:hypothetical protein